MVFASLRVSAPPISWLAFLFLYIFWFKLGCLPPSGIPIGDSVIQAVFSGAFLPPLGRPLRLDVRSAFYARDGCGGT